MYVCAYKLCLDCSVETDSDIVGLRSKRCGFEPWVTKILWSIKWQPTPVFLPGKFHAQRNWWATVNGVSKGCT